ncbi:MAG: TolC family protein [Cyclobacteriaceae bacterium]
MNKTQKFVAAMVPLLFLVATTAIGRQAFSLEEAVDYALEHNTTVLNAQLDNEIAKSQVGEFLATGLPQVNASLDFGRNLEVQRQFLPDQSPFNPMGDPEKVSAVGFAVPNQAFGSIRLEQMLFDGSFFIGLKAARTFTELSQKQHIKSKVDVTEAVTKAYYSVLINYKMTELIDKNYSRIDSLLNDTRLMLENGFVERIDLDRIKVQHNNAKVEYDHIRQLVKFSESLLKYQMGLPLDSEVSLTDNIESIDLDYTVEKGGNFNYANRIEYSSLQTQKVLNDIDLSNTKSQFLPKLNFYLNYGGNIGTMHTADMFQFGDWYSFSTVGINARWSIFDGFMKKNQAQQKRYNARKLEYDIGTIEGLIDLEIEQGLNGYNKSIDNMKSQKENMELAANVYETTKIKYREGVGSNSEVLDADASLKQSQTNYYNALYDALVAKVELQKAMGELYK